MSTTSCRFTWNPIPVKNVLYLNEFIHCFLCTVETSSSGSKFSSFMFGQSFRRGSPISLSKSRGDVQFYEYLYPHRNKQTFSIDTKKMSYKIALEQIEFSFQIFFCSHSCNYSSIHLFLFLERRIFTIYLEMTWLNLK